MDDSKHKAKTEATEGERPQSADKAVGTEASLKMTAEAFASSVFNRLTGTKDDLITSELRNAAFRRSGAENGVSSVFIHNSDEHRLSNSGELTTTVPTFADRLGARPSEGQQALFNAVKADPTKNTEVQNKPGTIEATASVGAMAKAETPAKAPVDERSLIAAGRSDVQVTQASTNTTPSLLDQLNNCEVKRGACTVEEAKQNGFNIESMKTATQPVAAEQQSRKPETPSLIEQLSHGNNKVGPCTIEEAKQNGFKIDAPVQLQVSTTDQVNRASKNDALSVPKDESSKVERSTGSSGPSLIEQLQSGNTKVGPCTVEEARQNGFQIGSRNTEAKPEDGQKQQDRFDGIRVEPSFKIDSSKLDPTVRTDIGLRTTEVQKNAPVADMRSNNQTEKSTGLLDQLNGYTGKTGACSVDEARQNGSLPTGRVDFAAKATEPARVDFKSSDLKSPEIRADFKSSDAKTSEGPLLADFSTKAPEMRPPVADFRPQVGSDTTGKVDLPQFKTADQGKDVGTRDLGFRDTTPSGRIDLAARTENSAVANQPSRTETGSASRDFSREQSGGRERESSTLAGSSRDLRDFADVRQIDRTIASSTNVERTSFNTIDLGKAQSAPEPARVAYVESPQAVRSEPAKVALDSEDRRAKAVELAMPVPTVASADRSAQSLTSTAREFTLPSFARISTGSEIDPTTGKAIAINTITGADKGNLIAVEKNIAAMLGISSTEKGAFSLSEKSLSTSIITDRVAISSTNSAVFSERALLVGDKTTAVAAGLQERGNLNGQLNIEAGKAFVRAEDGTIIARKDASMATLTEKGIISSELGNGKIQSNIDTVNGGKHMADGLLAAHKNSELPGGRINIEKVDGLLVDTKGRPVDINGQVLTNKVDAPGVAGISNAELAQLEYEDGVDENGLPIRRIREFGGDKNKRYLTGVELTIAAVIAMGGAAKVRNELMLVDPETGEQIGIVAPNPDAHKVLHRRTHMVSEGETLQSIAESLYQNQAIAWLIADLNGANIREENIDGKRIVELKSRQVLELPEAEEVTAFLNTLQRDFNIDNLITVVSETTIDRELLDSYLGTVSGGTAELEQSGTNSSVLKPARAHKPEKMRLPELIIGGLFGNHQDMPVGNASRIRNNQQDIPSSATARIRANHQDMPIKVGAPLRANQQDIPLALGIPARNNHQDMPVAAGVPARANHQDMPIKSGITGVVKDLSSKIGRLVKRPISNKLRPV